MSNISVGILRGGPSGEHDVSVKTGEAVMRNLSQKHRPVDIFITKEGEWNIDGILSSPQRLAHRVDVIFNGLHGHYGEDGKVQHVLDSLQMPYTGSGSFASSIAMNKLLAKEHFRRSGLRTPKGRSVSGPAHDTSGKYSEQYIHDLAEEIFREIAGPWVMKPVSGGSSIGVRMARSFPDLVIGLFETFYENPKDSILVEELIGGREATCGVLEHFRGEELYALPPVEIVPEGGKNFFDYEAKYAGQSREICPGNFSQEEIQEMQEYARTIHRALGLRHYSRVDFIVSRRGIYALEVNTLPGLTEQSLFPKSLAAVGCDLETFLERVLSLATNRR